MQTIYRFENARGNGLYTSGAVHHEALKGYFRTKSGEIPTHQPEPENDGLGNHDTYEHMNAYYGFQSIELLQSWIADCPIESIYEAGCKLVKLQVKACEFGRSQVRFRRRDVIAKHVYETPEQFSREV